MFRPSFPVLAPALLIYDTQVFTVPTSYSRWRLPLPCWLALNHSSCTIISRPRHFACSTAKYKAGYACRRQGPVAQGIHPHRYSHRKVELQR